MEHNEAIKQMVAERYLLGELTPEQRNAFEEHAFDCPECSLDLRAGAVFIDAAKVELPNLVPASPAPSVPYSPRPERKKINWQSWLRPAFAGPAFAALLAVVGYQNLSTIPSLRSAANQPSVLPSTAFHAGTRAPRTRKSRQIARRELYFRLNCLRIQELRLTPSLCTILRESSFGHAH
jgi:anti-sigma factor RsiW